MSRRICAALWLASSALLACTEVGPPEPQWLVSLGTDAPLPHLGDRIVAEVLLPDGKLLEPCSDCARQLAADADADWPLTFGVVPPDDGSDVWVRARLYRAAELDELGYPTTSFVIDRLAKLPAANQVTEVALELGMACLGEASDMPARTSCDPASGERREQVLPLLEDVGVVATPGSWEPAHAIECSGAPLPGTVCHPGGIVILGSTQFLPVSVDINPIPERLVRVPPFFMDVDEMTVGRLRGLLPNGVAEPIANSANDRCTWSAQPEGREELPVNCVSLDTARAVCAAEGKRLPTEAEWEYAGTNAGLETDFPVATLVQDVKQLCQVALIGVAFDGMQNDDSTVCVSGDNPAGLRAGGHPLDVTKLGVRNMTGSVSELTDTRLSPYADPTCWGHGVELLDDPNCEVGDQVVLRGGSWADRPGLARSASRNALAVGDRSSRLGFRCVIDGAP